MLNWKFWSANDQNENNHIFQEPKVYFIYIYIYSKPVLRKTTSTYYVVYDPIVNVYF